MFVVRLRNRIGLKYEMLKCLPVVQYSDLTNVCRCRGWGIYYQQYNIQTLPK